MVTAIRIGDPIDLLFESNGESGAKPAADGPTEVLKRPSVPGDTLPRVWSLGRELHALAETSEWTKVHHDGTVAYRTFARWAEAELGYGHRYINHAMSSFLRFTEDEARKLGTKGMVRALAAGLHSGLVDDATIKRLRAMSPKERSLVDKKAPKKKKTYKRGDSDGSRIWRMGDWLHAEILKFERTGQRGVSRDFRVMAERKFGYGWAYLMKARQVRKYFSKKEVDGKTPQALMLELFARREKARIEVARGGGKTSKPKPVECTRGNVARAKDLVTAATTLVLRGGAIDILLREALVELGK
jgi:hypothetical protein